MKNQLWITVCIMFSVFANCQHLRRHLNKTQAKKVKTIDLRLSKKHQLKSKKKRTAEDDTKEDDKACKNRRDYPFEDELTPLRVVDPRIETEQHHGYKHFFYNIYKLHSCHWVLDHSMKGKFKYSGITDDDQKDNCRCSLRQFKKEGDSERCSYQDKDFYVLDQLVRYQGHYSFDCDKNLVQFGFKLKHDVGDVVDCHYRCIQLFMRDVNVQYDLPTEANRA